MNLQTDRDLAATMIALAAHVISARSGAKMMMLRKAVTDMQQAYEGGGTALDILASLGKKSTATTLVEDLEFELAGMDRDILTRMGKLLHQYRGGHVSDGLIFTAREVAEMLEEALR